MCIFTAVAETESGLVVECQTGNFHTLQCESHPVNLQATVSKFLAYSVIRPTQPPTLNRTGNDQ